MNRRLYKDKQHKIIGGVCAGLADYFNIDVSIIRVLFLLAFVLRGSGGLIYIIMWIVVPNKPYAGINPGVDYVVPPEGEPGYTPSFAAGKPSAGRYIGGLALVLVGLMLLLNQFDIIPDFDYEYFWPTILIVIGLVFIFTSKRNKSSVVDNDPFNHPPKL